MSLDIANLDLQSQHLVSAFLAMESPNCLLSLARQCGHGSITEDVQDFIWTHCFRNGDEKYHVPYLRNFLKKLITEIESSGGNVLDEFYESYASYMASLKEYAPEKQNSWIVKRISFLFHDVPSYSGRMQLVVPLQCSLNMLQGDTGCALWPSSLFLSEFILSFPGVFTRRSCFEVGSGVGLLGICLQHVKASKIILTDGDASSLANLKLNLEMNKIGDRDISLDKTTSDSDVVQCIHLPWESAEESELQQFMPDIVFGADVIYDPACLPHLIRVLSILLNGRKHMVEKFHNNVEDRNRLETSINSDNQISTVCGGLKLEAGALKCLSEEMESGPVALIASVIRNIDTFNCFITLSNQANLVVRDLTETIRPFKLLPYMESYTRSDVHLFVISPLCK